MTRFPTVRIIQDTHGPLDVKFVYEGGVGNKGRGEVLKLGPKLLKRNLHY